MHICIANESRGSLPLQVVQMLLMRENVVTSSLGYSCSLSSLSLSLSLHAGSVGACWELYERVQVLSGVRSPVLSFCFLFLVV